MKKNYFKFSSSIGDMRRALTVIVCLAFIVLACNKLDTNSEVETVGSGKGAGKISAQPLPGGKKYFTVVYGNIDSLNSSWARIATWTFDDVAGTISANYWNWDSNNKIGKTIVGGTHLCTMPIPGGSKSSNCNVFAPTGWLSGSHASVPGAWSGSYTYDTTTGTLVINWTNGNSETWKLTVPSSKLARIIFQTGSSSYAITHGRGYGSNKAFTGTASTGNPATGGNYVPITSIPRVEYKGRYCWTNVNASGKHTCYPKPLSTWGAETLDFSTFTSASTGDQVLHAKLAASGTGCQAGCGSGTYGGVIHHWGGNNTSRKQLYDFFCTCLTSNANYPCYTGGLHPRAMQQIINDDGNLCGWVGVEAKNEAVDPVAYQFNLHDWILPALRD